MPSRGLARHRGVSPKAPLIGLGVLAGCAAAVAVTSLRHKRQGDRRISGGTASGGTASGGTASGGMDVGRAREVPVTAVVSDAELALAAQLTELTLDDAEVHE